MSSFIEILAGARASPLSRAQFEEVVRQLKVFHPTIQLIPKFIETTGDHDLKTSLRTLGKSNFFTKEIDEMVLGRECRIGIHSAKDLPDPLTGGLVIAALTKGVDASDSLVLRENETLESLPNGAFIGTSCERREAAIKKWRPDLQCVDIRGTIQRRLELLDQKKVDGVVVAEAALIRLNLLERNRLHLEGETAHLQGKLAVVAREEDEEMLKLFSCIDTRKVLYLGLNPEHFPRKAFHYPVIKIIPREVDAALFEAPYTHIIFTSKTAVSLYPGNLKGKCLIAIGAVTAAYLEKKGFSAHYIAENETQEGVIELLESLDLKDACFFYPRSARSRPHLVDYFLKKGIRHQVCDLYDTVPQSPEPVPELKDFDEIVFTSPSTVEAFLKIFDQIPAEKKITAIGPVTTNALIDMMSKKMEVHYDRIQIT